MNLINTVEFFRDLVYEKSEKKIAIMWENASIHNSKIIKDFYEVNDSSMILNVRYKPDFNVIEIV